MKLRHIIILQNKIDLVKEDQAKQQMQDIKRFIEGTVAEGAPIVPISAQLRYNLDAVAEILVTVDIALIVDPKLLSFRSATFLPRSVISHHNRT